MTKMSPRDILSFGATPLLVQITRAKVLPRVTALSPLKRFLEIGAGTCHVSFMVKSSNKSLLVIATDVSRSALSAAKKLEGVFRTRLDAMICCDCSHLPFKDETFEMVSGTAVLHHLGNPGDACAEACRVLKLHGEYLGIEGVVPPFLRTFVRFMTAANYRETQEGIREGILDYQTWVNVFARAGGMRVVIEPLIAPESYAQLINYKPVPDSYRPHYRIRYPYELLLGHLPINISSAILKKFLPGTVTITATKIKPSNPTVSFPSRNGRFNNELTFIARIEDR